MKDKKDLDRPLTFKQQLVQFLLSVVALYIAIDVVGSVQTDEYFYIVIAVFAIQFIQWLARPFFGLLAKTFGILGILFISLFGNAIIVYFALQLMPEVNIESLWGAFATAWLYSLVTTVFNWALVSQSDDVFIAQILRQNRKKHHKKSDTPGFLFVQLDGVSYQVMDWQLKAGNLPNIAKLINDDNYSFRSWHTGLPSTTPASQAGILFGDNSNIPAFRWYEKSSNELVVANQVKGAHLIEERLSNGKGLLVDGGVSIGNLFSGDAKKNIMVMSKLTGKRESLKTIRGYSSYFSTSYGFMRSFILSIGEMIKEIYQARRQVSRDMQPRIKRHGSYVLLRAITNVLLRDLQTNIVIQNMLDGVNSIYVDYLDYDEVAHHAGLARAESLASLSGIDKVIGILNRAKEYAPRPYEIILVSDHGQSQGKTFKQLNAGKTLEGFVTDFIDNKVSVMSETDPVEEKSGARSLLSHQSKTSSAARAASKSLDKNTSNINDSSTPQIVITGSGNLGNIWINTYKERALYEDIQKDYPELIRGLLATKGIGIMLIKSSSGLLCISSEGSIELKTRKITGASPIAKYSEADIKSLIRLTSMNNAPDIAIISSYDEDTGEVYAFEELVGNHGGLGGWQTEAILLHPEKFNIPEKYLSDDKIVGAETIHKIFKGWIKDNTSR
jgi:uncharacterized membrane protein YvlD (DUF360 family)